MSEYGFVELSKQLGASLIRGAEDNVAEAAKMLDHVKTLVEEIEKHVTEQAKALDEATARTRAYGERVLSAHKEFLGEAVHEVPSP